MDSEVPLLILLILLSGAFSSSEVAYLSMSHAKVRSLVDKKNKFGLIIHKLKQNQQRLLITILIGNNLANIAAPVLTTAYALKKSQNIPLSVVTGILTFVILLFGEIVPKSLAEKHSVKLAKIYAYPLLILEYILWPFIIFFEFIIKIFVKVGAGKSITSISEEELVAMVNIGEEEGVIEKHEKDFITNVLEFTDTQVEEIMIPRTQIGALNQEKTLEDAVSFFTRHAFSRIPIYKGKLDNTIGVLTIGQAMKYGEEKRDDVKLKNLTLLDPIFVPTNTPIKTLFNIIKKRRLHLALVVDEFGSVVGLVTLEDVLEEIVGEIEDESDKKEHLVKKINEKTLIVKSNVTIEELVNIVPSFHFPNNIPKHKTISYLILEYLKRFPKTDESFQINNMVFTIKKMGRKKIEEVMITKK